MKRLLLVSLAFVAGGIGMLSLQAHRRAARPDAPSLVERVREVARLETLEVTLYKKVSFEPDPAPQPTAWGDVAQWVRFSVRPPRGRAIVFARAHLGYDLAALSAANFVIHGDAVRLRLPPIQSQIELLPAETEVVDSSLDSAQTAELLEKARLAFERETLADPALRARVAHSAEASIRALLLQLGFRTVDFGDTPPS